MKAKVVPQAGIPPMAFVDTTDQSILVQVFDRIVLPTFVLDKDHTIIFWNSALEAISGLSRDEMLGTKGQWRPFYASARPCLADLILEGGQDADVKLYYTHKCRRSELLPDAYEAEDFFPDCGDEGEWLHFTASSIIDASGEMIGAIETFQNISARKKAELELLERERVYKELSITDSLTGLYNSRHFYDQLENYIEMARRYHHQFTLCFFDLDDFKSLNDNHGHLVGDKVLETFGALMRSCLRTLDGGFRYGGEEFAILLPSTDLEGAEIVADRVRESLQNYKFILSDGSTINATVSVGVTSYSAGDNIQSLMQRADNALYEAKDRGKNCIVTL